jgi:serine/threonine protein kinase
VWFGRKLPSLEKVVIKVLDKTEIYLKRAVQSVLNERTLMSEMMHPFLNTLRYAFHDESQLFLVTEWISGGDLSYYLHKKK